MVKLYYFPQTFLTFKILPQDPGSRDPNILWTLHLGYEKKVKKKKNTVPVLTSPTFSNLLFLICFCYFLNYYYILMQNIHEYMKMHT